MKDQPNDIAIATARARRDLYGLLVVASFLGFYSGMGWGQRMGRGFPTSLAILGIGLVIAAIGLPGLARRVESAEARTLERARAAEREGNREEAERLLEEIDAASRFAWVKQAVLVERAFLAVRAGALEVAEFHLGVAIAAPLGLLGRGRSRRTLQEARSLRALVRAARGYEAGAREDIAEVRGVRRAKKSALRRAALAEAIDLNRRGDRAGLKELLDRERHRIDKLTRPWERALAAALQQIAHEAEGASVYRQRAPGLPASSAAPAVGADPELDAWVAEILKDRAPVDPARGEAARARAKSQKLRLPERRVRVAVEADRAEADRAEADRAEADRAEADRAEVEERAELEAKEALEEELRARGLDPGRARRDAAD
jgi:chemosensory pili system protein ChpA (sensor histidine kinase/response regulator)